MHELRIQRLAIIGELTTVIHIVWYKEDSFNRGGTFWHENLRRQWIGLRNLKIVFTVSLCGEGQTPNLNLCPCLTTIHHETAHEPSLCSFHWCSWYGRYDVLEMIEGRIYTVGLFRCIVESRTRHKAWCNDYTGTNNLTEHWAPSDKKRLISSWYAGVTETRHCSFPRCASYTALLRS